MDAPRERARALLEKFDAHFRSTLGSTWSRLLGLMFCGGQKSDLRERSQESAKPASCLPGRGSAVLSALLECQAPLPLRKAECPTPTAQRLNLRLLTAEEHSKSVCQAEARISDYANSHSRAAGASTINIIMVPYSSNSSSITYSKYMPEKDCETFRPMY